MSMEWVRTNAGILFRVVRVAPVAAGRIAEPGRSKETAGRVVPAGSMHIFRLHSH